MKSYINTFIPSFMCAFFIQSSGGQKNEDFHSEKEEREEKQKKNDS